MMLSVFLFFLVLGLWIGINHVRRRRPPPGTRHLPGPRGFPLVGRVHDIPPHMSWIKFYEWSKKYGPIYQMEMFGSVHIWLSSEKVAHDLLAKRSAIYSDRPVITNLPDNRTSGDYLALQGRTDTWKRQRKLSHRLISASGADSYHGYSARERDRLLHLMCREPSKYIEWIEQFTSRTVSRLSWGTPHPAPLLRKTTFGLLETISPSGALPNVVPWLGSLPLALNPWRRKEMERHGVEGTLFNGNVAYVQKMLSSDEAAPSLVRTYLQNNHAPQEAPQDAPEKTRSDAVGISEATYVVGQMAIAGALTIGSPIQSFLLAMCHYPYWLGRLQAEIDTVLLGRCPEWSDAPSLPLLRAVVKEVIRWRPPVPTGIPHAVEKDDIYEGYFIPAGATVHALEWAMTRDESVYPKPECFNPGRWLSPEYPTYREPLSVHPNLNGHSQFGFGRRVCVGTAFAEQSLFLAMGGLAWALDIRKKRDPEIETEVPVHWNDFTPLLIAKPAAFDFDVAPRRPDIVDRLSNLYEAAKEEEQDDVYNTTQNP
ncbi:cytochrome P450 [Ophiocordyceps sinensis CO18]|uniref:Cytochrome P450 n=1 Tax=Ophiocordyceps sinensis (strain Co18 / CGMCC 3.14243) TaxID=911162 RepID=T5A6L6_OPHSC|nr:cytochrome P450 [Ophiocordyceps sinensis CO18]